jgi:hypothetical protein
MKVGLSNHQSVCLSVFPPLITFEPLVELYEIWFGGNAIQGDLDAIIFNPIASIFFLQIIEVQSCYVSLAKLWVWIDYVSW